MFIVMPMCFCTIGCQNLTFSRLFGCVFLVWRHHLRKVNKSSVRTFKRFFSVIFLSVDVPQYSNRLDYVKGIWPAIYFKNQKNHCVSSLRWFYQNLRVAWGRRRCVVTYRYNKHWLYYGLTAKCQCERMLKITSIWRNHAVRLQSVAMVREWDLGLSCLNPDRHSR